VVVKVTSQASPDIKAITERLWNLYAQIEKTSVDNALRELYSIFDSVNKVLVALITIRPPDQFLRERLVAYESVFGEVKRELITSIKIKRYHRAKADILKLIDIMQALDKEMAIYNAVLRRGAPAGPVGVTS
jgi:hypothetical protein